MRTLRRRPKRDPVTAETAVAIFTRDGGCLAPRLGGSAMDCWGRNRIEHVKREPRMGKRGDLLGTLCQGHTEDGTRAGYCWATDAVNRQRMRDHLLALAGDCGHVEPVYGCQGPCSRADPMQMAETA